MQNKEKKKIIIMLSIYVIILLSSVFLIVFNPSLLAHFQTDHNASKIWRFEGTNKGMIICYYDNFPSYSDIQGPGNSDDEKLFSSLKSIILNPNSESYEYERAAGELYYFFRYSKKDQILSILNTKIDSTVEDSALRYFKKMEFWAKIYTDTYIRGLMGDLSAVGKMDSLARFCPNSMTRNKAVLKMSELGVYDYFEYVKEKYFSESKNLYKMIFARYGKDPRYRDEVIAELENQFDKVENRREKLSYALSLKDLGCSTISLDLDEFMGVPYPKDYEKKK
jgi:hypothetical protein